VIAPFDFGDAFGVHALETGADFAEFNLIVGSRKVVTETNTEMNNSGAPGTERSVGEETGLVGASLVSEELAETDESGLITSFDELKDFAVILAEGAGTQATQFCALVGIFDAIEDLIFVFEILVRLVGVTLAREFDFVESDSFAADYI
jgi:hypothetical protein